MLLNNHRDLAAQYIFGSNIRSFIWSQSARFRDLGFLSDIQRSTYAEDLNNRGEVVGNTSPAAHAFFWSESTGLVDLGQGEARKVNDSGLVLGTGGPASLVVWTR
jgi:probable HAF family extracellular repeat protein